MKSSSLVTAIATVGTAVIHATGIFFLSSLDSIPTNTPRVPLNTSQAVIQYSTYRKPVTPPVAKAVAARPVPIIDTPLLPLPIEKEPIKPKNSAVDSIVEVAAEEIEKEEIAKEEIAKEEIDEIEELSEKIADIKSEPARASRTPAQALSTNKPPVYPRLALRRRQSGTVILRLHILATGKVDHVEIKESSGYALLDKAAKHSVANWVFSPEQHDNQSVSTWSEIPIKFTLENS